MHGHRSHDSRSDSCVTIRFVHSSCVVCGQTFAHRSTNKSNHCSNRCSRVTVTATKQARRRQLEIDYTTIVVPLVGCRWLAVASGAKRLVDVDIFDEISQLLWALSTRGYVFRRRDKVNVYLHHIVFGGRPRLGVVDHINRDQLDNRRSNLRAATQMENIWNAPCKPERSGYRGVRKQGQRWIAQISIDGSKQYLGTFDSAELAAKAYDDAALRLRGEFAQLNYSKAPS